VNTKGDPTKQVRQDAILSGLSIGQLLTQRLVTITTYVHESGGLAAHLPNLAAYVPLSRQAANLMYIKVGDNHQFNKNKQLFYLQHGTWTAVEVSEPLVLPAE